MSETPNGRINKMMQDAIDNNIPAHQRPLLVMGLLKQFGIELAAMTAKRDRLRIALEDAAFRLHTANVAGAFNSGEELSEYLATGYQNAHRALEAVKEGGKG